jgi:hypothetical protein
MSTWMVFCGIWAMCALCVVLFIRGAHPHVERPEEETRDDDMNIRVGGMKVAPIRNETRKN